MWRGQILSRIPLHPARCNHELEERPGGSDLACGGCRRVSPLPEREQIALQVLVIRPDYVPGLLRGQKLGHLSQVVAIRGESVLATALVLRKIVQEGVDVRTQCASQLQGCLQFLRVSRDRANRNRRSLLLPAQRGFPSSNRGLMRHYDAVTILTQPPASCLWASEITQEALAIDRAAVHTAVQGRHRLSARLQGKPDPIEDTGLPGTAFGSSLPG